MEISTTKKHYGDVLIKHSLVLRKASEALIGDTRVLLKNGRLLREYSKSIIKQSKSSMTDRVLSSESRAPEAQL